MLNRKNFMSAHEAVRLIQSGHHVYIQGSASVPETLVHALTQRGPELRGVVLHSGFSVASRPAPYCAPQYADSFFPDTCFVSNNVRSWIAEGNGSVTPCFLGEVPRLFDDGLWRADAVLLNCSMPDANGYVSYGVSADLACSAVRNAKHIIAQINPNMPFSYGDPVIHLDNIDAAVLVDDPLMEVPTPEPGSVETAIGNAIATHIPDGATLQIGVGGIPNAVIRALSGHKHLGLHTEAMTDGVLPLIERGIIDNSCKKVHPGVSVACLALGSHNLYRLMDHNKDMLFKDVAYTNDPFIIAQNPKVMAINSCLEIDLTGQICADSIGQTIFSGVGGQHDFVYGASRSPGGASFLAMTSTTSKGQGKIKPVLTPGAGVVTTRYQTNYVVTEHGIVNLRGKNMAQRARLLISIANPADRDDLERAARQRFGRAFSLQY